MGSRCRVLRPRVIELKADEPFADDTSITGRRLRLVGRFVSVSRQETAAAVCRRGAMIDDESPNLVVVGEEATEGDRSEAERLARERDIECIAESDLWRRLGLVDGKQGVRRLYSPAMLGELVEAPTSAVRRWTRRGILQPACWVNRLAYYDFDEARVAQLLSQLMQQGRGLVAIDSMVERLAATYPMVSRPLADLPLITVGGEFLLRSDDVLSEPTGQRCFDFDSEAPDTNPDESPLLRFPEPDQVMRQTARGRAWELSDAGRTKEAIEAWRIVLLESPPIPDDHFVLAEWLYADGQHEAARERYYAALEMDPDHLEARVSLGCVLSDQGEWDLAVSAIRGALEQHEEFADAHYHLARTYHRCGDQDAAEPHWRRFLEIAPESPWADEARALLGLRPVVSNS